MKTTIEINEANFADEVIRSTQPVLVDFWAEWCGRCKMLAPVLATEQDGRAKVAKVNANENPALAQRFGIQSIPALLYFVKSELRHQTVGVAGKQRIVDTLDVLAAAA